MAVSVVDLRYVFGRSLVVFDESTLSFSLVFGLKVSCIVCSTEEESSAML